MLSTNNLSDIKYFFTQNRCPSVEPDCCLFVSHLPEDAIETANLIKWFQDTAQGWVMTKDQVAGAAHCAVYFQDLWRGGVK